MIRFVNRVILFVQRREASNHMHRIASDHMIRFVSRLFLFVQKRTASGHMHRIGPYASHRAQVFVRYIVFPFTPRFYNIVASGSHTHTYDVCDPFVANHFKIQHLRTIFRSHTHTRARRMRSVCNPMWETTFPRNSHAGSGKPTNEDNIPPSMPETSLSPCPIRRGYFSKMLFPTWYNATIVASGSHTHTHARTHTTHAIRL